MSKRCCAEQCFNSQTINKNVSYFGFPKYEEYAIKWAVAANRTDLLTKKLNCITKYYLCSEHFSDDSFLDETKTRLKKTLYPVTIPIPTIFKCNFDKYIPNTKRNASGIDGADDTERLKRTPNYGSINDFTSTNRTKEGISMESLSVFHDHYNYLDISSSGLFFNDISDSINELSNENSFDNIDCDPLHHISEEMQPTFFTCRLCAKTFTSSQQLKDLSVEPGIYETLDEILPDQIKSDDGLTQMACINCLEKLNTCTNIINSFKAAQFKIQELPSDFLCNRK